MGFEQGSTVTFISPGELIRASLVTRTVRRQKEKKGVDFDIFTVHNNYCIFVKPFHPLLKTANTKPNFQSTFAQLLTPNNPFKKVLSALEIKQFLSDPHSH